MEGARWGDFTIELDAKYAHPDAKVTDRAPKGNSEWEQLRHQLRLARIAHQMGFAVDPAARDAARSAAAAVRQAPGERVMEEFTRVVRADDPVAVLALMILETLQLAPAGVSPIPPGTGSEPGLFRPSTCSLTPW